MPTDNQPWVYRLVTFCKHLLSMDHHHEMVLVLLQEPDNGFDKLLKLSCTWVDLTLLYNDLEKRSKENLRTLFDYTEKDKETHYKQSVS